MPTLSDEQQVAAWAASGAMRLTGLPDHPPLGPPAGLVPGLRELGEHLRASSGGAIDVDPLPLLGERAAISGLERGGRVSCGGSTRLLRTADGWLAIGLPRDDDADLVAAWLELSDAPTSVWDRTAAVLAGGEAEELSARGALLGLPVAALPAENVRPADPVIRTSVSKQHAAPAGGEDLVVVDLTALWAGPLCGSLLARTGATVIKVESVARPDGARGGPGAFFDLLNAGKRSVALDLRSREDVTILRRLLLEADVVIEASRPRALQQLGIDAAAILATGRPRVWASITGHGRAGPAGNRVAFGDDAAVAGGLVGWTGSAPVFCADAVADPLAGLVAADAVLGALADGGSWLLDVSMAGVAASFAGPTLAVPERLGAAAPRSRPVTGRAPRLGEHTAAVLAGLAT